MSKGEMTMSAFLEGFRKGWIQGSIVALVAMALWLLCGCDTTSPTTRTAATLPSRQQTITPLSDNVTEPEQPITLVSDNYSYHDTNNLQSVDPAPPRKVKPRLIKPRTLTEEQWEQRLKVLGYSTQKGQ